MNKHKLLAAMTLAAVFSGSGVAMAAELGQGASGPARGACKSDVLALCKDVKPGGGRIAACLKAHKDQVSDACKSAIKAGRGHRKGTKPGGAADESKDE